MKRAAGLVVLFLFFILAGGLEAARPFATDDAGVVEAGRFELECGGDFWSDDISFGLGFKHGLSERSDIGIGFGYVLEPSEAEGLGGVELGFKFALVPDLFAASLTGELGSTAYTLNGIFTYSFEPVEIDANLGYEATGIAGQAGSVVYSLALIVGLDKLNVGAEVSGDDDGLGSWLAGGNYQVIEGVIVDCGVSGGFEEDAGNTATFGIHYEF